MQGGSDAIDIIVQFKAKEGAEADLLAAMEALVGPSSSEPGCERFELLRSRDDAGALAFIERFRDQEAFDAHASADYVKQFLGDQVPELVADQSAVFYGRVG